jgi:hypothetical protein
MRKRLLVCLFVVALGLLSVAPAAFADTGDIIEPQHQPPTAADGFQAGTCTTDTPKCSPETPDQFYKTAGGHPQIGFTQYIVRNQEIEIAPGVPGTELEEPVTDRDIKALRVDLPPGLTVNPEATPEKCTLADFLYQPEPGKFVPKCSATTKTGEEQASLVVTEAGYELTPGVPLPKGFRVPLIPGLTQVPVYNLQPKPGEPALFGFVIAAKEPIFLETDVSWESDYHEAFTVRFPVESEGVQTWISRLVNFGKSGDGTFISNPTTCFDPEEAPFGHLYSTWFRAHSFGEENPTFPAGSTPFEAPLPPGIQQEGCDEVPFDPSIEVSPGTEFTDSASPATVTTAIPFEAGGENIEQSHLRKAEVTLPAGMGLNPSGSVGLLACSDAQFKKGVRTYANECPADSRIGTIDIETPPLPPGSLTGGIYVGEQKSNDPASGEEFRILAEAKSEALGIAVRLIGNVKANPATGQLTTVFTEKEVGPLAGPLPEGLPQVPFESVVLHFDGVRKVLTTPSTCAAAKTTSTMEPWSTPDSTRHPASEFTLTTAPGFAPCPTSLGARPFSPNYAARSDNTQGGAYSPFKVHIDREDGEQELKLVDATLPGGLAANLSGIPYCSEQAIAAAAANSGRAELASPSCGAASQVGVARTASGTGTKPAILDGRVYLAGPYGGGPLSLAVITPAVQGPFDLGTVVVRVALLVNPETTEVTAKSDAIPDIYGGVKLDIRSIDFDLNRGRFMHNPTNCDPKGVYGTIGGGGANPANPAAFSSFPFGIPYRATGCESLGFKPKLVTRLLGGRKATKRKAHPRLHAVLTAREGDANIKRAALTLPPGELLDNAHIKTICTRVLLAERRCPSGSVYGHATANSPLLDGQLSGPVYLVSSNHKLPDLLADLRGQINVRLRGVISTSKKAGLRTVFQSVPDAPVSRFGLKMYGGKKGLLINSKDLCKVKARKRSSFLNFRAQNGKQVKVKKLPLKISHCPKHKKHKKHPKKKR